MQCVQIFFFSQNESISLSLSLSFLLTTIKLDFISTGLISLYSIKKSEEIRVHLPSGNGFFSLVLKNIMMRNVCSVYNVQSVYLGHYFLSLFKEQKKKIFHWERLSNDATCHSIPYNIDRE